MVLKVTVKIMPRLCDTKQQQSLTIITWEVESLKIEIHWERKSENDAKREIYGSQLCTYQIATMQKQTYIERK